MYVDEQIGWGEYWNDSIQEALDTCDIALCIVSQAFLNSDYISNMEIPRLLERLKKGEIKILPLIYSTCNWEEYEWLEKAQYYPSNGTTLDKCTEAELQSHFKLITENLLREIREKKQSMSDSESMSMSESLDFSNRNYRCMHLITSVKGGVGKTLISLAVVASYFQRYINEGRLLAIDTNTMNNDLQNLLASGFANDLENSDDWCFSNIKDTTEHVFFRRNPFHLFDQASGFWKSVSEIISNSDYREHDIVVDSNMLVSNLVYGNDDPTLQVKEILDENPNLNLFFWIVWTYSALRSPQFVERGITQLVDARNRLTSLRSRIHIVHVLNPSALAPAKVDIDHQVKAWSEYQETERSYKDTIERLRKDNRGNGSDAIESVERILNSELKRKWEEAKNVLKEQKFTAYAFTGLKELIDDEKPLKNPLTYKKFKDVVKDIKSSSVDESSTYQERFTKLYGYFRGKGRPYNLLPISIHNPRFRAYIDHESVNAMRNIEDLQSYLQSIEKDIGKFLIDLEQIMSFSEGDINR